MKIKTNKKIKLTTIAIITITAISIVFVNKKISIVTNGNIEKTIGWGIKRNNSHTQPDVGSKNRQILEENNGICLGNDQKKFIYLTFDSGY